MPYMIIRPRVDEPPTNGFDVLRNINPDQIIHLTGPIEVGSLTGGMGSGKPSVAFVFRLPDGRVVVAETSLDLFTTAAAGLRAAHEN